MPSPTLQMSVAAAPLEGFSSATDLAADAIEQLHRVEAHAVLEHELHVLEVGDLLRRISAQDDEVRLLADRDGADAGTLAQELGAFAEESFRVRRPGRGRRLKC